MMRGVSLTSCVVVGEAAWVSSCTTSSAHASSWAHLGAHGSILQRGFVWWTLLSVRQLSLYCTPSPIRFERRGDGWSSAAAWMKRACDGASMMCGASLGASGVSTSGGALTSRLACMRRVCVCRKRNRSHSVFSPRASPVSRERDSGQRISSHDRPTNNC